MKKWLCALAFVTGVALPIFARAAETLESTVATCWSCHGAAGLPSDSTIPIIWGQSAAYIEKQLRDYRSGERSSQIMSSMSESVRRDDLARAADMIAKMPWPQSSSTMREAAPDLIASCQACHGADLMGAVSVEGVAPRLAGQFANYLSDQMSAFARNERSNSKAMTSLMQSLSEAERAEIAKYLASL